MKKIDTSKNYVTLDGTCKVELVRVNLKLPQGHSVLYLITGANDTQLACTCDAYGLVDGKQVIREVSQWESFKIDDKVLVWDDSGRRSAKTKAYFAGLNADGVPTAFYNGTTSWTSGGQIAHWRNCEKAPE